MVFVRHNIKFIGIIFIIFASLMILPTMVLADSDFNIPSWVRYNAGFWADGKIDDSTFLNAIEYLAQNGIITVTSNEKNIVESLEDKIKKINISLSKQIEVNNQHIENEKTMQHSIDVLQSRTELSVSDFEDEGDFYLSFDKSGSWISTATYEVGFYTDSIEWLNQNFKLPHDIEIYLTYCGTHHQHSYNSELNQVKICINFEEELYEFFTNQYPFDTHKGQYWDDVSTVMFEREIGHALIDAYNISLTASIEDSVNSLLYHNMIEWTESSLGQEYLHTTITKYYLVNYDNNVKTHPNYANSIDIQRALSMACALYGVNSAYTDLEEWIHKDVIKDCTIYVEKEKQSWNLIFSPYRKILDEN